MSCVFAPLGSASRRLAYLFGTATVEKAAQVDWTEIPVEVTDFVIEYLDADSQIAGIARVEVELLAGQTYIIDCPTIVPIAGTLQSVTISPTSRTIVEVQA